MNYLVFKIKRYVFVQALLSSVLVLSLTLMPNAFAQDETEEENVQQQEVQQKEESGLEYLKKQSTAYRVLGRELAPREIDAFGTKLTYDQIKNQFLHKEYRLAVIRVAIALGESDSATRIALQYQHAKPYDEVYEEFLNCRENYGSISNCLEAQNVTVSSEKAFEETALIAYYKVFGEKEEDLTLKEKKELFDFLKANDALTLSNMMKALIESLTDNDKKRILFKLLDEIKRPDLKNNKKFVDKILKSQGFTHEGLEKLLKSLK